MKLPPDPDNPFITGHNEAITNAVKAASASSCSVPCFECKYGHYETELHPYPLYLLSFDKESAAIIPDVPHEVCDKCGDVCFGGGGLKVIDEFKRNFRQNSQDKESPK